MKIPENIKKEHLLRAIEKIDNEGIPNDAVSKFYDVLYNNNAYPPKLLISYANLFANGEILNRNNFEGGLNTPCFTIIQNNGFQIISKKGEDINSNIKETYFEELQNFLNQAKTENLRTKNYISHFKRLSVKVSFGQGNTAEIPWIAFCNEYNTVSNGIYPVYLFYKNIKKLILAYGVSETNIPKFQWGLTDPISISDFFNKNNLGKPKRYGNSYIFKVYDVGNLPDKDIIDSDLNKILDYYIESDKLSRIIVTKVELEKLEKFKIQKFQKDLHSSNLFFKKYLATRFITSLLSKRFLILTGLSGSGKTKLAQAFAEWISGNENQYALIPVGADWTNREPLLGYVNGLNQKEYVPPESGALALIIRALQNPDLPYFMILDEMNLSHVERYFADFLSVMESEKSIKLHNSNEEIGGIRSEITIPDNLYIIGTVNIDETTYMFSPKVLDRANVIEFRISEEEIKKFLSGNTTVDMNALRGNGASMGNHFVELSRNKTFTNPDAEKISEVLITFFGSLSEIGAEFGYRSASEIVRLVNQLKVIDAGIGIEDCMDIAIMQKLLPKLHGSRRKLVPAIKTLAQHCVKSNFNDIEKEVLNNKQFDLSDREEVFYPVSLEKLKRMYKNAIDHGFASYAEA